MLVLALIAAANLSAQPNTPRLDPDASGTLYYVAFPDTVANVTDARFPCPRANPGLELWMFSEQPNRVTVTSGTGLQTTLKLDAGHMKVFQMPASMIITTPNVISNNTFRVESESPIVLYAYLSTDQGLEAWAPIPVFAWGTDYSAACIAGEVVKNIGLAGELEIPTVPRPAPAEILIIAAYDNTNVSIVPPAGMRLLDWTPSVIHLKAGEAYLVQSIVDTAREDQDDIAGTRILSDKPISVTSGNTRAQAQNDQASYKDNTQKGMMMECLSPADEQGTEFVYMPTMDVHRQGGGSILERQREYTRVYSTQGTVTNGYQIAQAGTKQIPFTIQRDTMKQFSLGVPVATYFKTEIASQALMHSSAVVALTGSSPCFRGALCLDYQAVAPYMVELTPREQWTTFAPYYAPTLPAGMQHYINVVTDREHAGDIMREDGTPFPITRDIQGTSLMWGYAPVNPGTDHYLIARNGAVFAGFVYGTLDGKEEYRPGEVRKKDTYNTPLGGGSKGARPLHPAEYEECDALSYGYPLAPKRRVLRPADSLEIRTTLLCGQMDVKIRALNAQPVGLRTIALDPGAVNARLIPITPARLSDIVGRTNVEIAIAPIDPLHTATATLTIADRTGKIWAIPYSYSPDSVTIDPQPALNYGLVTLNSPDERVVTIHNPLDHPVEIKSVRLAVGMPAMPFSIVKAVPGGPELQPAQPVVLPPGSDLRITIQVLPTIGDQLFDDSLRIEVGCIHAALPIHAESAVPLVYVDDLSFGTFDLPAPDRTLPLEICNVGRGVLTFGNSSNPAVLLEWDDTQFSVPQTEIDALGAAKLKPGECATVHVTFHPTAPGLFRARARFYSVTRDRRDTSIWRANVTRPGARLSGYDWGARWVVPKAAGNCTKNGVPGYDTLIWFYNTGSSPARVRSIELLGPDAAAGAFVFDNGDPRTTIAPGSEALPGDTVTYRLYQKVSFRPTAERTYEATVRLITEHGDTVLGTLTGTGIESHGIIGGAHFARIAWKGAYPATQTTPIDVQLRALPRRPLRVDAVRLIGGDVNDFRVNPGSIPFPITLQPGESRTFSVEFRPQQPGVRRAVIAFVSDGSVCDDSTNVVDGASARQSLEARGALMAPVLLCDTASDYVEIRNTGTDTVMVNDASLIDSTGAFALPDGNSGVLGPLAPGEVRRLRVKYTPKRLGEAHARVHVDAAAGDGTPVAVADVEVDASATLVAASASADRTPHGPPGAVVTVPVRLEQPLDSARVNSLFIGLRYDNAVVRALWNGSIGSMLNGTLLAGWTLALVEADEKEGELYLLATAPPNEYLRGTGVLLNPQFKLFMSRVDSSQVGLYLLAVGRNCATISVKPGLIRIDPVCGLNLRLIESAGLNYALRQNNPNPFNPSTDITFTLGLDGRTRLDVYDVSGRLVTRLVDAYMKSGTYQVTWDASAYPSGLYHYRLESGDWSQTNAMILRK
ncbi:MAG TPA: choice-of-anchor D domain-containing protein [Candidatus Kapabacteria bacterium]|nr:choice-of-anchor D domain-containing protein [Candidatus Kapabacteria bacterium]